MIKMLASFALRRVLAKRGGSFASKAFAGRGVAGLVVMALLRRLRR